MDAAARSVTGNTPLNLPESVNETSDSASGWPRSSRQIADRNDRAQFTQRVSTMNSVPRPVSPLAP
jgi:hypothetical protein